MIELDVKNTKTEFDESSTLSVYWIDRCFGFCPLVFSKDNKTFSSGDDPRINITHEQYDRVVLTIKNLTLNDSGNYGCALQINPTDIADVSIVIKSKWYFLSVNNNIIQYSAICWIILTTNAWLENLN